MATPRKLITASLAAKQALEFDPGEGTLPWDVVGEKLAELLRFLASAAQALVAELRERAASLLVALASLARAALTVAFPAAAVVAVVLVGLCGCCAAAGWRRQRRGPDGEEVEGPGGGDGPVVSYRRGRYKGGIFSMHPNKPIVC
ncbi:hypothetical protein SEVIR_3G375600v4 [Setaria viridis]